MVKSQLLARYVHTHGKSIGDVRPAAALPRAIAVQVGGFTNVEHHWLPLHVLYAVGLSLSTRSDRVHGQTIVR